VGKKRFKRLDAVDKVTGRAQFTHDVRRPDMLYAVMVTCPHAHARILKVDTADAEKMPGVKAVIVVNATGTALCAGWIIAALAAETRQQSADAARSIKVDYEILSFVVDADQAISPDSPKATTGSNVQRSSILNRGNVDNGFKLADVVHEGVYTTSVNTHCCPETHGCVAEWNGDELTVWFSTQGLWAVQRGVASGARISAGKARVITQHMGGGFGSKLDPEDFANLCVRLANMTKRPVHFMIDRATDTLVYGNKPGAKISVKVGAKKDGTLTAVSMQAYSITGYGGGQSYATPFQDFYTCPNVRVDESNVRINAGSSRAFRAPGHPQGSFCMEMALEELAMKLDIDPLELRLKNVSESLLDARQYELKLGAERFGWKDKFKKHGSQTGRIRRGVGCAITYWPYYGQAGGAVARCTLFPDGGVEIANGSQDLGTGNRTALAAAAAETLGIEIDRIKVSIGDTQLGLNGPSSGGSMTTSTVVPAVRSAAYKAQQQLFGLVAQAWQTTAADIDCRDGVVFRKSDSTKTMSWPQAASLTQGNPIVTTGDHIRPNVPGVSTGTPMRGAQFAEVEVDTETGKVRCVKIVAVQDCGKAMALAQAESQICGGVLMGVSFALFEERIMDTTLGRQINPNFENYKILGPMDAPEIDVLLVDVIDPVNNASAKGLGEPPHIPTAAAIGCAVVNAIGAPVRDLPITPYKVLKAISGREG